VDPQRSDRRRLDLCDELAEASIREAEGVAPAQDGLAQIGACAQGIDRRVPAAARRELVGIRERAAEAVAAVDRAGAARDQQRSARVLLDHSAVCEAVLANRVGRETGNCLGLERTGQNLEQQRIARVAFTHTRDETARYEQRKVR